MKLEMASTACVERENGTRIFLLAKDLVAFFLQRNVNKRHVFAERFCPYNAQF
jgi:hypothetical protein